MPKEPLKRSLFRVLKVFVALSSTRFGMTIRELQEEVGCSRRTLYRYLNTIEDCGIHLVVSMRGNKMTRRILDVEGRKLRIRA